MFQPSSKSRARERILAFGYAGSGKTRGWTDIADFYHGTETPGHFYCVSTEFQAAERALEAYDDTSNVTVYEALDWTELVAATEKVIEQATPIDWLCLDSIGNAWSYVQNDYTQQKWGKNAARYFGELQASSQNPEITWPVVNDQYRQWLLPNVIRFPGHVYACTPAEELREISRSGKDTEATQIRRMFQRHGVKPAGQKDLAYQLHSVLLFQEPSPGEHTITTVDDHAREHLTREPVVTFPLSYLRKIGWTIS